MKTFEELITNWVRDNFGDSEVEDPSWNIQALAEYLKESDIKPEELNTNTKFFAWEQATRHFQVETAMSVAEDMGVADKLAKEDYEYIADKFEYDHDMDIADLVQYEQLISDRIHYKTKGE